MSDRYYGSGRDFDWLALTNFGEITPNSSSTYAGHATSPGRNGCRSKAGKITDLARYRLASCKLLSAMLLEHAY
jgi:hypothetical protein